MSGLKDVITGVKHFFVPPPRRVIFLHIQKTAGSSIVNLAAQHYKTNEMASHADFIGKPPQAFSKTTFISGHFGYDYARSLMKGRYSFVFLRDPIERILSFYYFCRSQNPEEYEIYQLAHTLDLDDFLAATFDNPLIYYCIWNHQAWQLAHGNGQQDQRSITSFTPDEILQLAKSHIEEFNHVGFTESFDIDRKVILDKLAIKPFDLHIHSNATGKRPVAREISSNTRKLMEPLIELDRELYHHAWARRDKSLKRTLSE